MENKPIIKKSADARIVQAVRRLKSTRQKDNNLEVRKNQEDMKHPTMILNNNQEYINNFNDNNQGRNNINSPKFPVKNRLTKKGSLINDNSTINLNNNNNNQSILLKNNSNKNLGNIIPKSGINRRDINKSQSKTKISIDGSIQKPSTSSTNKTNNNKVFDYETLKKYKKRKISDFQKNLLSKKSLEKYRE